MAKYLRPRRGAKEIARSQDFVLLSGEMFLEFPNGSMGREAGRIVIGDGQSSYSKLNYTANNSTTEFQPFITDPSIYVPRFTNPSGPSTQNAASYEWGASTTSINNIGDGSTAGAKLPVTIGAIKETLIHNTNSIGKIKNDLETKGFATTATRASGLCGTTYTADKLTKSYRDNFSTLDCYGLFTYATTSTSSGSSSKTCNNTAALISRVDQTYVNCSANASTYGSGSGGWGDFLRSEISMNSAYTSYDKEDDTYISIINASTAINSGVQTYNEKEMKIKPDDITNKDTWDDENESLKSALGNKISDIKLIRVNIPCTQLTQNMSLASYVTSSLPSGYTFIGWQTCGATNGWVATFPFYLANVLGTSGNPWWSGELNTNTGCGVDFYYFAIKK